MESVIYVLRLATDAREEKSRHLQIKHIHRGAKSQHGHDAKDVIERQYAGLLLQRLSKQLAAVLLELCWSRAAGAPAASARG